MPNRVVKITLLGSHAKHNDKLSQNGENAKFK